MGFNSAFKGLKIVKNPGNGRLNNLNVLVLNVLIKSGVIPLLPYTPSWRGQEQLFHSRTTKKSWTFISRVEGTQIYLMHLLSHFIVSLPLWCNLGPSWPLSVYMQGKDESTYSKWTTHRRMIGWRER